jgi:hypothetical protein
LLNLAPFDGMLYVGTVNSVTGGELWKSLDGRSWVPVVGPGAPVSGGFGIPSNRSFLGLGVFQDHLYVGVDNERDGAEIWRYERVNASGGAT